MNKRIATAIAALALVLTGAQSAAADPLNCLLKPWC